MDAQMIVILVLIAFICGLVVGVILARPTYLN
jgi:uncharacterized protein YneF (UPF0154 family)